MERIPYHRPLELSYTEKTNLYMDMDEILSSGQLTNGKYVRRLENKIKGMYNVEYCIATSSCTQGLRGCLQYLHKTAFAGIYRIELPSFTWGSLRMLSDQVTMEWIDIDKDTWLPNIKHQYSSFGLHTFGNVMEDECTIYDGSHALGCNLKEIGEATVFSLAPTKMITSCEGGLIITNNDNLAEFVRDYRDLCARMSEIHAIIGLQTLTHLEEIMEWKKKVHDYYKDNIDGIFQKIPYNSNYNTIGFLNVNDLKISPWIEVKRYYEPLHKGLPNTDYVYENIVALPSYVGVDYKKIVEDIKNENNS